MKSAVLVFPGINRERDMARALKLISGHEPQMVWHAETALPAGTDLVVIPGGFSYGDYLRCGAIAAPALMIVAVQPHTTRGSRVFAMCMLIMTALATELLTRVPMLDSDPTPIYRVLHQNVKR